MFSLISTMMQRLSPKKRGKAKTVRYWISTLRVIRSAQGGSTACSQNITFRFIRLLFSGLTALRRDLLGYSIFTLISLILASSVLGSLISRIPFLNDALTFSCLHLCRQLQ